jgi:hypothetical protein
MKNKIIVITADNRIINYKKNLNNLKYYELSYLINKTYCSEHNINYKYLKIEDIHKNIFFGSKDTISSYSSESKNTRSASWTKLLCIFLYLKKKYDYVVYMDSDCIFSNHNWSLHKLTNKIKKQKKEGLFYCDKPWNANLPNAGFMILHNSKYIKHFIKYWWNSKDLRNSHRHPYEQKLLHKYWVSNLFNIKKKIILVKNNICSKENKKSFIYHITSNNENREDIIKSIIKKKKIIINLKKKNLFKSIYKFYPKTADKIMNKKKYSFQDYFIIFLYNYLILTILLILKKIRYLIYYTAKFY